MLIRAFKISLILIFITAGTVTARAQGHVTDVVLSTDPASLQAHICPVTLVFNGHITMDGPGTVTYQIVRSDGAASSSYSITFLKAGSYPIRETWTLGDATTVPTYEGWVAIRVLSPNAVESNHADAEFGMICSAPPAPYQPQRARFRVSLTGFINRTETRDHLFEADGPGDEIYQAPYVLIVDRIDGLITWRSGGHGPIFGGIRNGRRFPTDTPEVLSSPPAGLGFPGVLFEGELIEGTRAVAIAPTLWEWDGDERLLRGFFAACATARLPIAGTVFATMTAPFPDRLGGLGTALDRLVSAPIITEGDADRPIGITVSPSFTGFRPQFLLLTYERAMFSAMHASDGLDTFAMDYTDPTGYDGDYTLFLKVELLP